MPEQEKREVLQNLYDELTHAIDSWTHLDGEERIGTLRHACDEIRDVLAGSVEWEVGVCERDDEDEWEHYYPKVLEGTTAQRLALREAREDGFEDPKVYMSSGPYPAEPEIDVSREELVRI